MPDYIQITFFDLQPEQKDILIARLSDAGFEGFEEIEDNLEAFIKSEDFDKTLLEEIVFKYQLHYKESAIKHTNWNQVWEKNFQPVMVEDFVSIRADFHPPVAGAEIEIVITPKMSFGTGHHATTSMMIGQMRGIKFKKKSVFDFGTGTGVLAILAEKLGADFILATDNDEWSIENAKENIAKNNCTKISLMMSSTIPTKNKFDILVANINKNVIMHNLSSMVGQLRKSGILVISGLLTEDFNEIISKANSFNLKLEKKLSETNWICLKFKC